MFPFASPTLSGTPSGVLVLNVTLTGYRGSEVVHFGTKLVAQTVTCYDVDNACGSFYVVNDPDLSCDRYVLTVNSPNGAPAFLGDILFRWEAINPDFMVEQVVIRLLFSLAVLAVAIWYSVVLYEVGMREWTTEQMWSLVLIWVLILMDNPLFALQAFTDAIFWPVLFSMFDSLFLSLWMLYCLLYMDMVRTEQRKVRWNRVVPWIKLQAVFVYFILSVALNIWEQVLFANNPVIRPSMLSGPSALFYVVALWYAGLVCWLVILMILLAPRLMKAHHAVLPHPPPAAPRSRPPPPPSPSSRPPLAESPVVAEESAAPSSSSDFAPSDAEDQRSADWHDVTTKGASSSTRIAGRPAAENSALELHMDAPRIMLLHSCGPMMVVTVGTLISIVAGSLGPFGTSAPGFMFFHTIYTVTVLFWVVGFWPVGTSSSSAVVYNRGNERQPLVSNPFSRSERQSDESEARTEAPLFN